MAEVTKEDVKEFIRNMSVLDLSRLVKELEDEFGVSAAAPVAVVAAGAVSAGAEAAAAEEQTEFEELTAAIEKHTLSSAKAEAKNWLKAQLDKLTLDAANYKLNLVKSLQSLDFSDQRKNNVAWLKKITKRLSLLKETNNHDN